MLQFTKIHVLVLKEALLDTAGSDVHILDEKITDMKETQCIIYKSRK